MIRIRRSEDRGHFDHGWLNTRHTFSFGRYYDAEQLGFRTLRVLNEDRVQPGQGFGEHGHDNMEIVSYVLAEALEHRDSMGNGSVLRPGTFQRMSAGTGVRHSEFNHSPEEPLHFYQIWITPETDGIDPGYEERSFTAEQKRDRFALVGSRAARDGSLKIHQDADLYLAELSPAARLTQPLAVGRYAWVQVLRGSVALNGHELQAGDGAAFSDEPALDFAARSEAEVLLFDMA